MKSAQDSPLPRERAVEDVLRMRETFLADAQTESVPIDRVAGRILGTSVVAEEDHPPRSFATMDGFALDATEDEPFALTDAEVYPEDDPDPLPAGHAARIATGAPLPDGATAVLKREDATVEDGRLRCDGIEPGTYTYARGSNVAAGETVIESGEPLSPKDALLLGDLGYDRIDVVERCSVGLLATGTEIDAGRVRDLDSPMLAGLVRSWGHEATHVGSVPDTYDVVVDRIDELAEAHDVVMTTGGTSVGAKDHVVRALDDLGTMHFHRVALRPGKPIAFATIPDRDAVAIAIPGKPIGAHTVAVLVAGPFFHGSTTHPTEQVPLARDLDVGVTGFEYAVPVTLDDGVAMPLGHADSALSIYRDTYDPSVLSSSTRASRADGFFLTESDVEADTTVDVVPYATLE